jgi:hypothetical protein
VVHAQPQLQRGDSWRWDGVFTKTEVKTNNQHVTGSPDYDYNPEFDANKVGLQSDVAKSSISHANGSALAQANAGSSISASLTRPSLAVAHGYSNLCTAKKSNTRSKAHSSGLSEHWVLYKHPGGLMKGSIQIYGNVEKADTSFTGECYGRLGANTLFVKYNMARPGWDVTGTVNGKPVSKKYGRKFEATFNCQQQMTPNQELKMHGFMMGVGGVNFLSKGLHTIADNFGSNSEPVRTDEAKMRVYIKITP